MKGRGGLTMDAGIFTTRVLSKDEVVLEIRGDLLQHQIDEFQKQLDALTERDHQIITLDLAAA